ncbi:MAG TPA: TetR/AcrR family transcriptional regulator [Acidimicrobiia bacterium]
MTTGTSPRATASRRTRAEARAETRTRLLDAALTVFSERGIAGATVEEITEAAGFTRGAFYSNFVDKNDLVLALLDRHNTETIRDLDAMLEEDPTGGIVLERLLERSRQRTATEHVRIVMNLEFWLFATRNPESRERLAGLQRVLTKSVERIITAQAGALGIELPVPVERAAKLVLALDNGVGMLALGDPVGYPDTLLFEMLDDLQQAMSAFATEQHRSTAKAAKTKPSTRRARPSTPR